MEAQYGAVVLGVNNKLTHTPSKPSDMNESLFNVGYATTSYYSDNLYKDYIVKWFEV